MLRPCENPKLGLTLEISHDDWGWYKFLPENPRIYIIPYGPVGEHCE